MFNYNSNSRISSALSKISLDSIEEDEIEPWHGFIQKLSPFHLDALHAVFKESKYKYESFGAQKERGINKEDFVNAIEEIFGNCKYSLQATILFSQVDHKENGRITWDQFLDFVIENGTPKPDQRIQLSINNVFNPPHVQRDTISKIVLIETVKHFCYAIISKYGCVGLYDGNMNFLTSYYAIMSREDITRKDVERRRRNRWITDAIFLRDLFMFVITSSARNITVYDASGLKHVALWLILGTPNIIHCFAYHSNLKDKTRTLFMGDESGQMLSLIFLHPKGGLLPKKHDDKLSLFYWIELQKVKEFVVIKYYGRIHNDHVKQLKFYADNNTIVSCSHDVNASVVIKHQENRRKSYVFKMNRGATCFSLNRFLKILVTGSDDGLIRVWNITVTSMPIATLKDHQTGIVDIQIFELQNNFISCSKDGVLKLWNIKEQKCIQTLKIKFPSFDILGKNIEWPMNNSIYPGPKRHTLNSTTIRHKQDNFQNLDDVEINSAINDSLESPTTEQYSSKSRWQRSHIYIICCNYMAHIDTKFNECPEIAFDGLVLPPPPLQNSVLIPKTWKISRGHAEDIQMSTIENQSTELDQDKSSLHLDPLEFILNKDLLEEYDMRNDINYRIATLETKKLQMKDAVSKCAPYLALNLQEIQEIRLPSTPPVPNSKRIRKLVDKTQKLLSDANLKAQVLSESSSSSRNLSSRSSIITFD